MAHLNKYSKWDGTQKLSDFGHEELMDELSEAFLKHGDMPSALKDLMSRGLRDGIGAVHLGY